MEALNNVLDEGLPLHPLEEQRESVRDWRQIGNKQFDFDDFKYTVKIAVEALNNVLDEGLPLHPLEEQRESVRDWRQIGLGIFGLSDMLIKMGIVYGKEESIYICDMIGHVMADTAIKTSALLASKYGTYPKYNKDAVLQSPFFTKNALGKTIGLVHKYGLLNSQLLTIAPTGTLSTMLGVSGGIEPIFANYYTRKTESLKGHDEYYKVYTPIVKKYMDENNITDDKYLPEFFITSQNIPYKNRIDMQSIWQKHIDASISSTVNLPNSATVEDVENLYMHAWEKGLKGITIFRDGCNWQKHIDASISSTVNLPNSATVEDVENLYMHAWEKGLKGITIFRDGCKRTGILTTSDSNKKSNKNTINELKRGMIIKADDNCIGKKRTLTTGCGTLHCEAFFDPDTGNLLETYFSKGSSGGCNQFMIGLSRMTSLSARGGIDIYSIVDQLKSSGTCPSYAVRSATKHDTSKGSSCPVAIGNALIDMYEEMQNDISDYDDVKENISDNIPKKNSSNKPRCPECGDELVFEGGCNTCKSCGYSKCD